MEVLYIFVFFAIVIFNIMVQTSLLCCLQIQSNDHSALVIITVDEVI